MKVVVCVLVLCSYLFANSISVEFIGESKHNRKGFNEDHNLISVSYRYYESDYIMSDVKFIKIDNSYNDKTYALANTFIYTPIKNEIITAGIAMNIGFQNGYYVDNWKTMSSDKASKLGIDNTSLLILPTLYLEMFDVWVINLVYIPDEMKGVSMGLKFHTP